MVWLPDAMEGPTPVSALIHAATMVTAGVYMVARCTPLYMLAPQAQLTVSLIGGFTALLAALIALTQTDLKRVLAYSTVSQLGYMFLGLGTGSLLGIGGAMFHLVTHAFFKALLFLGAGSVMHAMGGVIDMRRFGGLKRIMPVTYGTFLVGSLALAGLFPLSGFWSKDTILSAVRHAGNPTLHVPAEAGHGTDHGPLEIKPVVPGAQPAHHVVPASLLGFPATAWYTMLFWVGIGTAFLTAFYTFRAVIMTFHGPERIPEEAGHHAHESPPNMTIPLVILAFGSAFLGLILGEWFGWFDWYLNRTLPGLGEHHEVDLFVAGVSTLVAVVGIGLAYVMYGKPSTLPARIAAAFGPLTRLSERKFYLDEIYHIAIILPLKGVAHACRFLDWILVDGVLVEFFARVPREIARLLRPVQNGLVQFYALSMMLMTAFIMWALLLR
jgi:NADH-quinone oxidoreductase subunit L